VIRGEVWRLADGRDVLIISLHGLEMVYGALLVLVLHPQGRYPDTAMSVTINVMQLRADRFTDAQLLGEVDAATLSRADGALRAVLDL